MLLGAGLRGGPRHQILPSLTSTQLGKQRAHDIQAVDHALLLDDANQEKLSLSQDGFESLYVDHGR